MSTPAYISTILRLHDPRRLDRLELALMSLCGQRYAWLSPVIMLQDFSAADEDAVRQASGRLPWRAETRPPEIVNLRNLGPGDHRSKLLQAGLQAATGAYIAFLDFDDYLYPRAYSTLVERIRTTGKAAAFGAIAIAELDPGSPAGACLAKRPFPHGNAKYDVFKANTYPIHSFLMKAEIAKSVTLPEHLCALEDYYFLLSTLKDHDWDDELTRCAPIADYVHWTDRSNTVAGTSGEGETGRPWQAARGEIERYKQTMTVKVPLRRLLTMTETDDHAANPLRARSAEMAAIFVHAVGGFLPFVGLWRRLDGGIDQINWDGDEARFSGSVRMRGSEPRPVAGLLFLSRPSRLRPSYRYLTSCGLEPSGLGEQIFAFAGRTPLTQSHLRKGRSRVVLFVLASDGRLYRTPHAGEPSLTRTIRLHEAA